jgi:hypothetical protein
VPHRCTPGQRAIDRRWTATPTALPANARPISSLNSFKLSKGEK